MKPRTKLLPSNGEKIKLTPRQDTKEAIPEKKKLIIIQKVAIRNQNFKRLLNQAIPERRRER